MAKAKVTIKTTRTRTKAKSSNTKGSKATQKGQKRCPSCGRYM